VPVTTSAVCEQPQSRTIPFRLNANSAKRRAEPVSALIATRDPDSWELVTSHSIAAALPAQPPSLVLRRPVALANGILVAGDRRDTAFIQGPWCLAAVPRLR
jgi:hypothetical protein